MTETSVLTEDTTAPDDVRAARAWLMRCAEPGSNPLWWFVDEVGPVAAAEQLRIGQGPVELYGLLGDRGRASNGEADVEAADRRGIRLVVPEDAEWPRQVDGHGEFQAPPLGLWVRGPGNLAEAAARGVALVGSRASTAYGEHVAAELGCALAGPRHGRAIISGGAYGIDAAAHRGALAADGTTVAVLACGVDKPYPVAHDSLFARIAETGLLVSEFPPGAAPLRHRFLTRNRLIAGLGQGMVVVEAAARSGALQAARRADAIGRLIMAVPGPVTSAMSVGCHAAIKDGAVLVTSADDVVAALKAGV